MADDTRIAEEVILAADSDENPFDSESDLNDSDRSDFWYNIIGVGTGQWCKRRGLKCIPKSCWFCENPGKILENPGKSVEI